MLKKAFLFSVILLLAALSGKAEYCISLTDTTIQSLQENQKAAIQKQSLDQASSDPIASFSTARKLLELPATDVSNQQKSEFFRRLAKKFEDSNHFKQALESYKIADSLASVVGIKKTVPTAKPFISHGLPKTFYLFAALLIIFLIFFGYSALGFFKLNVRRKTLLDKQDKLSKELDKLQSELDAKVKSENRSKYKELEGMQDEEAALKSALKKAEEAGFLRNAFIANLGFDVRTPLNGIIGFANMLETELAVEKNLELYEYAANIEKSGHRLMKLLNNVIDLSSLESNALKLEILPVAPESIIKNIYDQYATPAREKNLIFKSKIDPELRPVLADEKNLEKVLMQIVDNAVKYTESGFVTLSAAYDREKDIDVIEIKDTGPGIDKKHQRLLFDMDTAVDEGVLVYGEGTGIGLKLAKKLVDMMNAGIELNSGPGEGTTFRLLFPCSKKAVIQKSVPADLKEPSLEVTMATELGNLDIFVVEDDRMNRIILEKMLKNMGSVKLAVDGKDCMEIIDSEAAKKHFYQIMLFDINLPGDKDGVALMKEIRAKYKEYQKVPFIAQTAYAMASDKDFFLKEGFDSYLSKPINRNELISTIKQQFSIFGTAK